MASPGDRFGGNGLVVVQEGDTLCTLAQRLGVPWRLLQLENNLQSDLIFTGEVLSVPTRPSSSSRSACLPSSCSAAAPCPASRLASTLSSFGPGLAPASVALSLAKPLAPDPTHRRRTKAVVVQPGDNAWKIAVRFGLTLEQLQELNGSVPDVRVLYPGDRLLVPEEAVDVPRRWLVDDHVSRPQEKGLAPKAEAEPFILGRKGLGDLEGLTEFEERKSNSRVSGETLTQLSLQVNVVQEAQYPNSRVQEAGNVRGVALIFSMEDDRPGGAVDRGRLEGVFKMCKFDTQSVLNDSAEGIKDRLLLLVKNPNLADDDCFVCCINAHGDIEEDGKEYIFTSAQRKERLYFSDDILKPIKECKYLARKPKVFIINACRGTGTLVKSKTAQGSDVEGSQVGSKSAGKVRLLHDVSDCLVLFSTSYGDLSFRDEEQGTIFITALTEAISEGFQTKDLLNIFTSVIDKVTKMEVWKGAESTFQCPVFESTLRKELRWSVPLHA